MESDSSLPLKGVHGTCVSSASNIRSSGFNIQNGHLGSGAYFWKKTRFSDHLAQSWWQEKFEKGYFSAERNQDFAKLEVEIDVLADEILDITNEKIHEILEHICYTRCIGKSELNKSKLSKAIKALVEIIERQYKRKVKVVKGYTLPPTPAKLYSVAMLSNPITYTVKDPEVITIIN